MALVVGATGQIGGLCLEQLLERPEYDKVIALTRRTLPLIHPRLENRVVDFDRLSESRAKIVGDDLYLCLGTTMRQAGSQEAFRRVDYDYTYMVARHACANGAKTAALVSAAGADVNSPFGFYSKVKGQVEDAIKTLDFAAIHIMRPSLLLGSRAESRPFETLGKVIAPFITPLMVGPLNPFAPIEAKVVAAALIAANLSGHGGEHIYHYDDIVALAGRA